MRRALIIVAVALAATLGLAGCSAASSGSSGSVGGPAVPAPQSGGGGNGAAADSAGEGSKAERTANKDRSVVVTGDAVIAVGDPIAAAADATRIVTAAGGRVDGRSEQAGTGGGAATARLTLRIPADKLDATLDRLRALGRADRVTTNSADVTGQTQDLDARITALRTTIQRMLELEQRATDTTDLIAIESAIGDRQGELESLEAQQRDLADQVAMSTITLTLHPKGTTVAASQAGFGDGLVTGWSAFVAFWGTALVVLGVLLPWLVTAGVVVALIFGIRWIIRRMRRSAQAVDASTSSSTASP
jgi:hypothetical protein